MYVFLETIQLFCGREPSSLLPVKCPVIFAGKKKSSMK